MRDAICSFAPSAYQIETNVPIQQSRVPESRFPFALLDVGHSFKVRDGEVNAARTAATKYSKETGKKFISRRVSKEEFRFWRVA